MGIVTEETTELRRGKEGAYKTLVSQMVKKFPVIYGIQMSCPHTQQPAPWPCPELDKLK
jgi:hypothetical protein